MLLSEHNNRKWSEVEFGKGRQMLQSAELFEGCLGQIASLPCQYLNTHKAKIRLRVPVSFYRNHAGAVCRIPCESQISEFGRGKQKKRPCGFVVVRAILGSDKAVDLPPVQSDGKEEESQTQAFPAIRSAKRVVLVRHGQSTWNEEGRIQGSSDFAVLTQKGEAQAETSKQMLLSDTFDVCFHSPLSRSKRTAEIIWDTRKKEMIPEFDLREIDLYSFQGLLKHEGKERFGEAYRQWQKDAANFTIDGHYPVRELWARAKSCWTKILAHKGQSILVVAHNAVNQALVATAIGLGPEYFRLLLQSNCGVSVLDFTPRSSVDDPPYICLNRLNQTPNSPIAPGQSGGRKPGNRIMLVCHGTTGSIAEGRFPASVDEPVNMLGVIQSQKTAELLLDLRVSSLMCSPQLAAMDTAAAIAQVQEAADCLGADCVPRYVEIRQMQELRDMSWGAWQGQLQKQVVRHCRWQDYLQQDCNEFGDRFLTFWDRTKQAWHALTEHLGGLQMDESNPEKNIVVVGHELVHIAILCHCLGLTKDCIGSFHLDTGSISVIDFPDGPSGRGVIRCLNYTAHFGRWSVPVTRPDTVDEDF